MPAAKNKARPDYVVHYDHQGRTCIEVERNKVGVAFIPMGVSNGFQLERSSIDSFDKRFKPIDDYPPERACQLYSKYAIRAGATQEVIDLLLEYAPITKQQQYTMLHKRDGLDNTKKEKTEKPKKLKTKAQDQLEKSRPKSKSGNYKNASELFKTLVMAGELTDDEIFAVAQEEFGLDEKKRSYTRAYRRDLEKAGKNPPGPVEK